ncbi:MAG: PEP-CTERM sorting domain-containing protein [Phycisphaerae bacterium]|jgi:hypothetical protein
MKTLITIVAALAGVAHASVIPSAVGTFLTLGGASGGSQTVASGTSNKQVGIADIGSLLGNFGAADIRSNYDVSALSSVGPRGGNEYLVTVRVGSIRRQGPFARFYDRSIINPGATLGNGATIASATISFGAGSGGLRFDDFGAATVAYVDNSNSTSDLNYAMKINDGGFVSDIQNGPTVDLLAAVNNADGSVGFSITYNANSLFNFGFDASSAFGGDLAAFPINGFASQFVVEVVPAPSTGLALGLGAAVACRRRRR